jgi:hypothetical protein
VVTTLVIPIGAADTEQLSAILQDAPEVVEGKQEQWKQQQLEGYKVIYIAPSAISRQ